MSKPAKHKTTALAPRVEAPTIRPEVLLEFVRALVRNTCGGDVIALALYATRDAVNATDEEMAALVAAIKQTRARNRQWPPGFMPEDSF
jgi:hypothetical protein